MTIYLLGAVMFSFALMGWERDTDDVRDIMPWWAILILSIIWPLALGCFAGHLARKVWEGLR